MQDTALGSSDHARWLEAQLSHRPLLAASPVSRPAPTTPQPPLPRSTLQPISIQSVPRDSAAGTPCHQSWLGAQIRQAASRVPAPYGNSCSCHSPPRQPDVGLPGGVNAALRGQDLSARTHHEWLERQLQREPRDPFAPSATEQHEALPRAGEDVQHAAWLEVQLRRLAPGPSSISAVASMVSTARAAGATNAAEDYALGSRRHSEWLERQVRECFLHFCCPIALVHEPHVTWISELLGNMPG